MVTITVGHTNELPFLFLKILFIRELFYVISNFE